MVLVYRCSCASFLRFQGKMVARCRWVLGVVCSCLVLTLTLMLLFTL